jgi:O-antigen/teichoic acid export membrane protein
MVRLHKNLDIRKAASKLWYYFCSDSLFRNSVYLMLSTGVQAVFGFAFWYLNARLYTPSQIGIGSTLISATASISYFSLLGFNNSLVKFLPASHRRNEKINSSLILVIAGSFIVSVAYVAIIPYLAPELGFINRYFVLAFIFITLSVFSAANLLTDNIFIAYRASKYNLIIYTIQSVIKLFLPLVFISWGAIGIFSSVGVAALIAFFLSIYYAVKKFEYVPKLSVQTDVLKIMWKFSSASYFSNIFNILPTIVLPIIIVNRLGAAEAGYYYMAFMLCNLLYAVVYSIAQSLFAEGAHGEVALGKLFRRSVLILAVIMIPAGIVLALVGPVILQFFGKSYGIESGKVVMILALSSPIVSAYVLSGVLLRIMNKIYTLVFVNAVYAIAICLLAYMWVDKGLIWIAYAWTVGNLIAAILSFAAVMFSKRSK